MSASKSILKQSGLVKNPVKFMSPRITYVQRPGEGRRQKVTMVEGVGIGPELADSVQKVFDAAFVPVDFKKFSKLSLDDSDFVSHLEESKVIMRCGLNGPRDKHYTKETIDFRKKLNLYADIVHAVSYPHIETRHENLDFVVIRENTEGEYSGLEHEVYPGVVESLKVITRKQSLNIAKYAFEYAYLNDRKKVTAVHKANIMKLCDGEFLKACQDVAADYPMINYEEMIIDNCCMQLTLNPWQFDVMLLPNLYGAIVSNIAAAITAGPGMIPGANIGNEYALFEPGTRHIARDIAGKNVANPTGCLLSSVMMLRYMGLPRFADRIEEAIRRTLDQNEIRTPDIGGKNSTTQFTNAIIENLE